MKRFRVLTAAALMALCALALRAPGAAAFDGRMPEPGPPTAYEPAALDSGNGASRRVSTAGAPPAIEWTLHKTPDGRHPDGHEQQLVWLMNRARANPTAEGIFLAELQDPAVDAARRFFQVDAEVLRREFAGYAPKPPAAFDARLYQAAQAHSEYLIGIDGQSHTDQFRRIQEAGFHYGQAAGIVYSYAKHALYGHAGFNIDWGPGTDGTQDPPGHRLAIMSVNGAYTSVGYAAVAEADPASRVGPLVITGNLCSADTRFADHFNRFLVGTVWSDANGNDRYDPGEGLAGVRVQPDRGDYYAVTAAAGGYALPLTFEGGGSVTFSGGAIATPVARGVTAGAASVLLDLEYTLISSADAPVDRIGVFRPSTGAWLIDGNGSRAFDGCGFDDCHAYGKKNDRPLPGDWNGDGLTDLGVFRPKKRTFFLDGNADRALGGAKTDPRIKAAAAPGDLPVAGDWSGGGRSRIGIFRPATGEWLLDLDGDGAFDDCPAGVCARFGESGDLPVAGDWNGDGRAKIGLFRPRTGEWLLDLDGDGAFDDCPAGACARFGESGDLPVAGDWNGDGRAKIGLFRPATGEWLLDLDGDGAFDDCPAGVCARFGESGDLPVIVRR
jgi:hypothetical protein